MASEQLQLPKVEVLPHGGEGTTWVQPQRWCVVRGIVARLHALPGMHVKAILRIGVAMLWREPVPLHNLVSFSTQWWRGMGVSEHALRAAPGQIVEVRLWNTGDFRYDFDGCVAVEDYRP